MAPGRRAEVHHDRQGAADFSRSRASVARRRGLRFRSDPIELTWTADKLIGRLTIGGEHWAAVEWSEKRKQWCIEDADGRCLSHKGHIHGAEASRDAAVALAKAMIRDGRMPDPETARRNRKERVERQREKRNNSRRKFGEQEAERDRLHGLMHKAWDLDDEDERATPIVDEMAAHFDFADPDLWKSNSFASFRRALSFTLAPSSLGSSTNLPTRSMTAKPRRS